MHVPQFWLSLKDLAIGSGPTCRNSAHTQNYLVAQFAIQIN